MSEYLTVCQVCDRDAGRPVSSRQFLTGLNVYMCKTCWAIWYDGTCDLAEIRKHSLQWPVNCIDAYRKSDYPQFNPEVLPEV